MGFQVVGASNQIETLWAPVVKGDICYVGQIVMAGDEGVLPIGVADGIASRADKLDATGPVLDGSVSNIPFGIVIGTNARVPSFDTTQKAEQMTELIATSSTSDTYFGVEGPLAVNGHRDSMEKLRFFIRTPELEVRFSMQPLAQPYQSPL